MNHASTMRKARQLLAIDQLLGLDAVPVAQTTRTTDTPAAAPAPPAAIDNRQSTIDNPLAAPIVRAEMPRERRAAALAELEREACAFFESSWPRDGWRCVVFGEGDPAADLMFIGEGPGAEEDAQGRPFVGRAGQLLDKQIAAMGLERGQVYIANIAKTRPPGNRVPTPEEAMKCMPWVERQVEIIQPRVIVSLGATSAKVLLNDPKLAITRQRGQWKSFRGIDVMPTFHPAYLLRQMTVENRRRVWDDLRKVMERLGLPIPERK